MRQSIVTLALLMLVSCISFESTPHIQTEGHTMTESPVPGVTLRFIEANGLRMRIAEAGDSGPLVLLAHGWPESWYSWRHQLTGLSAAGYRVVAPDMRGYGGTEAPPDVDDYNMNHLTADMVGVLDALGEQTATIVGHDWGSPVAQYSALFYPERFTSLVMMSVPYSGRTDFNPMTAMRLQMGNNFYYILYHNEPDGVAEAEYDADPRGLISRLYLSPDSPREPAAVTDLKRAAGGWIPRLGAPKGLPDWLTADDLDYVVSQFGSAGFRGGVNYYRNIERNWVLSADRSDFTIRVPSLFIAGSSDVVINGATTQMLATLMAPLVPDLRGVVLIPEKGHWIQQEHPEATNQALLEFLAGLNDVTPAPTPSMAANQTPAEPSALHQAIGTGDLAALTSLIDGGADLNEKEPFGGSSPLIAATTMGNVQMAQALIDAGADLHQPNSQGSTPLHVAALFCHPEIVKALLAAGADKNSVDNYGATALSSVSAPFDAMRSTYDMVGAAVRPLGIVLDYKYLEATRPLIAKMLE
jgi:pimeloyl-ACP methyl ester carboxylesterase